MEKTEQTFSFFQLISDYKIEIPIIQRDYAQGREDKTEIRNNFLEALLSSMQSNKPRLKLDFVYGSIVNGNFQPLDGQQRLTTLFLLHWYAAHKDHKLNDDTKRILSRFTYETRISSRDFCYALINNVIAENIEADSLSISDGIINSPWFFLSWKKDPTIKAMLRTINDIDVKFRHVDDLWDILVSSNSPIYFYFVLLENIGLTDDLYIKMNARGKLLSAFENFKAGLQKHIQDKKWEEDYPHKNTFAFKIDTDWADFYWDNYCIDKSIDDSLMRFIATIAMIRIVIEKTENDRVAWIKRLQDDHNNIRPAVITKGTYLYLYECFNLYKERLAELRECKFSLPLWRHSPSRSDENYLDQIVNTKLIASYSHKILFYAQTSYLLANKTIDYEKYMEWMRVVRNIVSRAHIESDGTRPDIIRSPETFDGAVNLVAELAKGCSDIYAFLASDIKIISSFARNQVEEERKKAKLIMSDIEYKNIIWKLEDTDLLMGRIDFALFCCDYINSVDKDMLRRVAETISIFFGDDNTLDPKLRRALLTVEHNGHYEYYNYWWSYWNIGKSDKRCLIDKFRVLEYCIAHQDCRVHLKKLVRQLCITPDLQEIINSFIPPASMPNWQVRLIKEPEHLSAKFSNFIAIPNDKSCCYLLRSKRPRELDGNKKIE